MVVFWSVELGLVDEWVCFCANSEDIEVRDGEDSEVCHMGFGVCSGWEVFDESDDFLLGADEWLDVGFAGSAVPHMDMLPMRWGYAWVK